MVWRRCHPRERGQFKAFLRPLLNDATDDKSSAAVRGSCPPLASPDKTTQTFSTLELETLNFGSRTWRKEIVSEIRGNLGQGQTENLEEIGNQSVRGIGRPWRLHSPICDF